MDHIDVQNLKKLARIIKKDNTKEGAMSRLINAGVFDTEGKYTKHYAAIAAHSKKK